MLRVLLVGGPNVGKVHLVQRIDRLPAAHVERPRHDRRPGNRHLALSCPAPWTVRLSERSSTRPAATACWPADSPAGPVAETGVPLVVRPDNSRSRRDRARLTHGNGGAPEAGRRAVRIHRSRRRPGGHTQPGGCRETPRATPTSSHQQSPADRRRPTAVRSVPRLDSAGPKSLGAPRARCDAGQALEATPRVGGGAPCRLDQGS